ncbi:MAG: magnesium transporter CorA family protein [Eubacterium sp.]|jgi:magnesium transporter|nr:magnesium transporter CorA family protein [Eubacterium sp.]NBI86421.1 magnesium transporter CorA family protein [Lachnospiraceae bacterium]
MRTIYKTDNGILSQKEAFEPDVWVNLISPNMDELTEAAEYYEIDIADLRAALDEEESSRVQIEDGYTLILVDIPLEEIRNDQRAYTTIPLGILLVQDAILTVCGEDTVILNYFYNNRMRGFSTKKKMRFVYQILLRTTNLYQALLRVIDKKRSEIEKRVGTETTEDKDLINLHELETNLVYFATSLSANKVVLDRLTRYERIKQYPEDKELLDDVIVENRQAIEMTNIYRDIIHGARELVSTIINNRLNNVMKFLTSITLVMAIPTIISGIYGMNVSGKWMPLSETPHGFAIICVMTGAICVLALLVLKKRKML